MSFVKRTLILFMGALLAPVTVQSQITLLSWDFSGIGSGVAAQPTTATANFFATDISNTSPSGELTRGSGIGASSKSNAFSANGFSTSTTSFESALTEGDYFTFSVATDPGLTLDLDSLDIYFDISDKGPSSWGVFTDVTGFTATDVLDTFTAIDNNNGELFSLSLADSALDNVAGTIEVRLVGFGATNGSGTAAFIRDGAGNDITLNGNVIPEPSTYALIFGGLALGTVFWQRRRKTAKAG